MVERGQHLRFALEARESLRICRECLGQELQGYVASKFRVACAIELAHPARSEQADYFVRAETSTRADRHMRRSRLIMNHDGHDGHEPRDPCRICSFATFAIFVVFVVSFCYRFSCNGGVGPLYRRPGTSTGKASPPCSLFPSIPLRPSSPRIPDRFACWFHRPRPIGWRTHETHSLARGQGPRS